MKSLTQQSGDPFIHLENSLGPFSDRFTKVETLYQDPTFAWLRAEERRTGEVLRLQQLPMGPTTLRTLDAQWQALKSCGKSLWVRPQELLQAPRSQSNGALLLTWMPPGRPFSQTPQIQSDECYLKWLTQALQDLEKIHQHGLLHLAQNESTWILFRPEENEGEEQLGLSDLGLLTEVPLGATVSPVNALALAPEILRSETLGPPTDLYALACLLLKQRSPHLWENVNRLDQILRLHWDGRLQDWVPQSKTPLHQILRKMLAADPKERPANATVLLAELAGKTPQNSKSQKDPFHQGYARARAQARQLSLNFNTAATLIRQASGSPSTETTLACQELAEDLLEKIKNSLPNHLQGHHLYLQAELKRCQGQTQHAAQKRQQALKEVYQNPDPALKALLWLAEARDHKTKPENKTSLKALENAWESVRDYPEPALQQEVLFAQGSQLKSLAQDKDSLEKLHQAWQLQVGLSSNLNQIFLPAALGELLSNYQADASLLLKHARATLEEMHTQSTPLNILDTQKIVQAWLQVLGPCEPSLSETGFATVRDLVRQQKNLKMLLWVEAHHVRHLLTTKKFIQAKRELKALIRRNQHLNHEIFLDLLTLKFWLATGETLWKHDTTWETRLSTYCKQAAANQPFSEIHWPPHHSHKLLADFLETKKQYSQAQTLQSLAQETTTEVTASLKNLGYKILLSEKTNETFNNTAPLKVESLLESQTPQTKASPNTSLQEMAQLKAELKQLKTQRTAWQQEKAQLQTKIETLNKELAKHFNENLNATSDKETTSKKVAPATGAHQVPKLKTEPTKPAKPKTITNKTKPSKPANTPLNPTVKKQNLTSIEGESEKTQILAALKKHQGHRSHAATELGIHRRTLLAKLKKYELEHVDFLPGRAEIEQALNQHQGKKSTAAKALGLSRASFYRRLKELDMGEV